MQLSERDVTRALSCGWFIFIWIIMLTALAPHHPGLMLDLCTMPEQHFHRARVSIQGCRDDRCESILCAKEVLTDKWARAMSHVSCRVSGSFSFR